VPLAERKAAALSLDATLLAELLGKDGIKQLLDADVIASIEADLQCLSAERRVATVEQAFDLLRTAGPFTRLELAERAAPGLDVADVIDTLLSDRRLVELRIAGQAMLAVAEDIPRLRDGLGIPVPPGVAATFTEPAAHPIDDLVLRWARTHGPFVVSSIAQRYGLGRAIAEAACDGLVAHGSFVAGSFVDMAGEAANERRQYCHSQVLALIKRRTLALLRKDVEPVEQVAFARFLGEWQGVGSGARGVDAVLGAIEQLSGYPMPASAVESMVLPARVADYASSMLD
jgi:ATP-dependent helicase Lhr and Lhr-like helicase